MSVMQYLTPDLGASPSDTVSDVALLRVGVQAEQREEAGQRLVSLLDAGGHGPAYYDSVAPDAIRFLLTALEAEGRRLA